jgi:glycosyltransferase involved in cell wall biosynthesis
MKYKNFYKNMKKINLIFFLPDFKFGGAGKSILSLCKNISKKKFNIIIISLNKCYYKEELKKFSKVIEIKSTKVLFAQIKIREIIKKIVKANNKSIFISNLFYANALTAVLQKKYNNLKFIFSERTPLEELSIYFGFYDFLKKLIIKIIVKFFYKRADLIIANSKFDAKQIKKFTGVNTKCVYPGCFQKLVKKNKKKKNNHTQIISVGRLSKEKGFDILIKSFKNIDKNKYSLHLIGDGAEKNNLKNLIKKYNLEKNIKILGYKKNIYKFIKKADLLINTSHFEGFGRVVVEALSCGIGVICSRSHGGIYEILKNQKYGDLFNNGDIKSLEIRIKRFLDNPKKLINKSREGQKDLNRFSEKTISGIYEKIFINL